MKKLILPLALMVSFGVSAQETYVCKNGTATRVIEVVYESSDSPVPCKVNYQKSAGDIKTLWQAKNEQGYCESKAKAFVKKQQGWGWDCAAKQSDSQAVSTKQ